MSRQGCGAKQGTGTVHVSMPACMPTTGAPVRPLWQCRRQCACTCADAMSVMRQALTEVLVFMSECRRFPSQHTYLRERARRQSGRPAANARRCVVPRGAAWCRVIRHSMVNGGH